MVRLHAKKARQFLNNIQLLHFDKAGHDCRDIAGIANGHKKSFILHIPAKFLSNFIGIGFLPQNTPAVLGIQKRHAVMAG